VTTLIVWACVLAYLAAAAAFARNRVTYWSGHSELFDGSGEDRSVFALAAIGCGLLFPIVMPFYLVRSWLFIPVDREEARVEQLEKDLAAWRAKRYSGTDEERAMAAQIVETLENALKATS
jgi:hypothetical protein